MTDQQAQEAEQATAPSTPPSSETSPERRKQTIEELQQNVDHSLQTYLWEGQAHAHAELESDIQKWLSRVIEKHDVAEVAEEYNLLVFFDEQQGMTRQDTMDIYSSVISFQDKKKPTLLVLHSNGGQIEAAYLIGKLCLNHLSGRFAISVPRQAKSAATLLCCAADEIHMGGVSELGPIDPQIDNLPALGLKNTIEHIAALCEKNPKSADMFSNYLNRAMRPEHLGYYERIAKSAEEYAKRLLVHRTSRWRQSRVLPAEIDRLAHDLVYDYQDHRFVIDIDEAERLFVYNKTFIDNEKPDFRSVVRGYRSEYFLGDAIYRVMDFVRRRAENLGYQFWFAGSIPAERNRFQFIRRHPRSRPA